MTVHQAVRLYVGTLEAGAALTYHLGDDRHAWVQVVRGAVVSGAHQVFDALGTLLDAQIRERLRTYMTGFVACVQRQS